MPDRTPLTARQREILDLIRQLQDDLRQTGSNLEESEAHLRDDGRKLESWQQEMDTLAPELDGALELIRGLTSMGIVPAIGHTAASPEQIREAVAAGAKLSTHLGNGSHIRLPRLRNYLWEQLAEDALMAGIIADGYPDRNTLCVLSKKSGATSCL